MQKVQYKIFFNAQYKCASDASTPYFKISTSYSVTPSLSKNLNPNVRTNLSSKFSWNFQSSNSFLSLTMAEKN